MPFPHETVLITGATAGIGRALAERMIENGIFVIAVGRRKDRLDELVEKHGADRVAAEVFDVSDLDAIPRWADIITNTHPTLSCIVLNAGIQRTIDLTQAASSFSSSSCSPSSAYRDIAAKATAEATTNYLSPLLTAAAFLPHLLARPAPPDGPGAAILAVTSALALVPLARCPSYCATKAALHSLAWSLRAQLAASPRARHVRVVELLPPAVQTELHALQPELVAAGQAHIGMPLGQYIDETWAALQRWDPDENEIMVSQVRANYGHFEDEKRVAFEQLQERVKTMGKSA